MIVVVPTPATEGTKLFELTPVPEYVPPLGVPVVNANELVLSQTASGVDILAVVTAFTTIVDCAVLEQPFAFVYEYVIANVPTPDVAGSNEFPVTPVPLYVPPDGEPPDNVTALAV